MTALHLPAHKLCYIKRDNNYILFAATGSYIQSLSISTGAVLSLWPRDDVDGSSDDEKNGDDERPTKRLKRDESIPPSLGREGSELSEGSIEIVAEGKQRQKGERRKPKIPDTTLPNVSHLVATSDGRSVIAVTAEDKSVRVFRVSKKGRLRQLSSRSMPKKCCAIALSQDEQTILTADKFGDVYALPLFPNPDYQRKIQHQEVEQSFKPSASELTVHTRGNLDALRQQQKQKKVQTKKDGPDFDHKLLLGHVSLLTDLVVAEAIADGKPRSFVLTADRDEHIRVSRGIPQTHVIHNFCLGHTEFVSRLCVVPWSRNVLIAGNGEPSLRMYSWLDGELKSRYDFLQKQRSIIEGCLFSDRSLEKIAVSGIWPVSATSQDSTKAINILLISLEGLPLLFMFELEGFELSHGQVLKLDGNILDVVPLQDLNKVGISIDTLHESGSCKKYRDTSISTSSDILMFTINNPGHSSGTGCSDAIRLERLDDDIGFQIEPIEPETFAAKREEPENDPKTRHAEKPYSALGEFIYGLENLRKRRGMLEGEDPEEVQVAEDELEGAPEIQ